MHKTAIFNPKINSGNQFIDSLPFCGSKKKRWSAKADGLTTQSDKKANKKWSPATNQKNGATAEKPYE